MSGGARGSRRNNNNGTNGTNGTVVRKRRYDDRAMWAVVDPRSVLFMHGQFTAEGLFNGTNGAMGNGDGVSDGNGGDGGDGGCDDFTGDSVDVVFEGGWRELPFDHAREVLQRSLRLIVESLMSDCHQDAHSGCKGVFNSPVDVKSLGIEEEYRAVVSGDILCVDMCVWSVCVFVCICCCLSMCGL